MKRTMLSGRRYLLLAVGIVSLMACSDDADPMAGFVPPPPAVTVSVPVAKNVTDFAYFSGTTEALEAVTVRARVEGVLENVNFVAGSLVEKGQLLYSIDPRPYIAELESNKANLEIRKAELQLADATSTRMEVAYNDKAVSEVAVLEARANLAAKKAAVVAAEAAVRNAELNLSYTEIVAPISGRIGRTMITVGNLVGANERTVLTNIVQDNPLYVYFTVSERDVLYYRERAGSMSALVESQVPIMIGLADQKTYPFEGRVDYIDNRMDADTGTIFVRGILSNEEHQLLPGLFARIQVPVGEAESALLIPDTAIGQDQQGHFVFIVEQDNTVRYQAVKVGALDDGLRVVEGVAASDRVIINGIQKAQPGAVVTPMDAPMDAGAPAENTSTMAEDVSDNSAPVAEESAASDAAIAEPVDAQ